MSIYFAMLKSQFHETAGLEAPVDDLPNARAPRPKWFRIECSFAAWLERNLLHTSGAGTHVDKFVCQHAVDGGAGVGVRLWLRSFLSAMELGEEYTGVIIFAMWHHLTAKDLMMCTDTWRPLLVTALLVAVRHVCPCDTCSLAEVKIKMSVRHWWPSLRADAAFRDFVSRPNFRAHQQQSFQKFGQLCTGRIQTGIEEVSPGTQEDHIFSL